MSPAGRRLLFMALLPLVLVAGVEAAFRAGAYEAWAKPSSHAGTSARLKQALEDPRLARIDTVLLGNSRAVYGIDHAALAAAATARGQRHANLSMPGTHWMTIGVLAEWLRTHHPEVRAGVIAMSVADFEFAGNGHYELGIVTPFRTWRDTDWIAAHVPIEKGVLATYPAVSALMAYREDLQDLLLHPQERRLELAWWRAQDLVRRMDEAPGGTADICAFPIHRLDDCGAAAAAGSGATEAIATQCRGVLANAQPDRFDDLAAMRGPLPPHMQRVRDLIRAQLLGLPWKDPPIVVLMPVHGLFRDALLPVGIHEWALEVLRPLAADGRIVLLDRTDAFLSGGETDCRAFLDLYHQNADGRAALTGRLTPDLLRGLGLD